MKAKPVFSTPCPSFSLSPFPSFFFSPPPTTLPSPLCSGKWCYASRHPKSQTSMLAWWLGCGQRWISEGLVDWLKDWRNECFTSGSLLPFQLVVDFLDFSESNLDSSPWMDSLGMSTLTFHESKQQWKSRGCEKQWWLRGPGLSPQWPRASSRKCSYFYKVKMTAFNTYFFQFDKLKNMF